jgi:hypothetical protein
MDRYEGKPFLKLLEAYVLSRIGKLSPDAAATLRRMEPTLRKTFGRQGTWDEIVSAVMQFDEGAGDAVRRDWARWVGEHGDRDPAAFARSVADAIVTG